MSASQYATLIKTASIRNADRSWFPRWIYRYASGQARLPSQRLSVSEQEVIRFLRSLRDHGTPAWQRLQAARAVESYRNLVLKTGIPTLHDIYCGSEELATFGEAEIREFLTNLAVVGKVAAKTQDQALAALLFLYQKVMRRDLAFIDAARSKKPVTLPVVLSRQEVDRLIDEFHGRNRLIFQLLYGSQVPQRQSRVWLAVRIPVSPPR